LTVYLVVYLVLNTSVTYLFHSALLCTFCINWWLLLIFSMDSTNVPNTFINDRVSNRNFVLPYVTFLPHIL